MVSRIRMHDWASTSLGSSDAWPVVLRSATDLMLAHGFPMVALWGPDLVQIYNDGYRLIMGNKHPAGLGQPTRECWPEVWHINAPIYDRIRSGETVTFSDALYPITRSGRLEDAWFTLTYSPIRGDNGDVAGVLVTVFEVTDQVLARRALTRSEELRSLAVKSGGMGTWHWNLRDGRIWGDASFLGLWGFPPSEEPRDLTDFTDRMAPQGQAEMGEMITRAIASGEEFDGQLAVLNGPSGGTWVRWRGRAEHDRPWSVNGVSFDVTEQRELDQRLRESEARHRLLVESWTQAVWEADARGVVVADSPSWRAYTGQTLEEWLDYGWLDATHPDDRSYAERQWRQAIAAREPVDAEFRLRVADGGWRWTNVRAAPVLDATGRVEKWAGMNIDIDARKRAEAALRESEAKYRTLFENMTEGYAIGELRRDASGKAIDWRFIEFNPALQRYTGMDPGASAGRWFSELFPGADRSYWLDVYQSVVDTQSVRTFENYWPPLDRWLGGMASPADEGRFHIMYRDVSEQKRLELSLRESGERLRTLVEGVPQLIWRADTSGAWTWASPQWTAYTGLSQAESSGTGWLAALHPDDRNGAEAAWAQALSAGALVMETRVFNTEEGQYRWFATRATPVLDTHGHTVEWLGTSTDIHDLRELQERQQVLVAELQHRTRNLMGVVRATMEATLRSSADLPDFATRYRDRVDALSRVQGLLSRLNDGDRITFDKLIHDEMTAVGAMDRVTLDGPDGIALRSSTVQTFALALHELATNALKYGALAHASGQLTIAWRLEMAPSGGKPWLHVDWHESGVVMPATNATPQGSGQGRQLIERGLPYQLGARTTYVIGQDGIWCSIAVPVSNRTATEETGK